MSMYFDQQAIQDFFDPTRLAEIRALSEDLLCGKIDASKHRFVDLVITKKSKGP